MKPPGVAIGRTSQPTWGGIVDQVGSTLGLNEFLSTHTIGLIPTFGQHNQVKNTTLAPLRAFLGAILGAMTHPTYCGIPG